MIELLKNGGPSWWMH
jgi:hypothetical protein